MIVNRVYGPTRLFVWMAMVFLFWWQEAPFINELWSRFKQEARIAHGIPDKAFIGWLWLRWQLNEDELPVERWLYRKRRPPFWRRRIAS